MASSHCSPHHIGSFRSDPAVSLSDAVALSGECDFHPLPVRHPFATRVDLYPQSRGGTGDGEDNNDETVAKIRMMGRAIKGHCGSR